MGELEEKLENKSPPKPVSETKDEMTERALGEVAGGVSEIVVTKKTDGATR